MVMKFSMLNSNRLLTQFIIRYILHVVALASRDAKSKEFLRVLLDHESLNVLCRVRLHIVPEASLLTSELLLSLALYVSALIHLYA